MEITIALTLGLLIGSFLNVVIYRLPQTLFADWRNQCREFIAQEKGEEVEEQTSKKFLILLYHARTAPAAKPRCTPGKTFPYLAMRYCVVSVQAARYTSACAIRLLSLLRGF